jgi:hypothetical protein
MQFLRFDKIDSGKNNNDLTAQKNPVLSNHHVLLR